MTIGNRTGRRWRPDLIFLDIGLPGMSGYEVAAIYERITTYAVSRSSP